MPSRLIRLRRPPVVHVQDGPFVPGVPIDEIDAAWNELCAANPAYFDGRIYHVLGVHRNGHGGATIHVIDGAYRGHAVQRLGVETGVVALGVKGLVEHNGRFLFGKRAAHVAQCAGEWEFAPGGGVDPGKTTSPVATILAELEEETGFAAAAEPIAMAMIFDEQCRTWEIVYRMSPASTDPAPSTNEYDELRWCERGRFPPHMSSIARAMMRLLPVPQMPHASQTPRSTTRDAI